MTNHKKPFDVLALLDRNCLSFTKEKGILKIDRSARMPRHRLSVGDACSFSPAPGQTRFYLHIVQVILNLISKGCKRTQQFVVSQPLQQIGRSCLFFIRDNRNELHTKPHYIQNNNIVTVPVVSCKNPCDNHHRHHYHSCGQRMSVKNNYYQYAWPNDKLPSVKRAFLRAKREMRGRQMHLTP